MVLLNDNKDLLNYELIVRQRVSGESFTLLAADDSVVESISYKERISTPNVDIKIRLRNANYIEHINLGDIVDLKVPVVMPDGSVTPEKRHRAFVLNIKIDDTTGDLVIEANNRGYMLNRNDFFLMIEEGETTSDFIRRTASLAYIPLDNANFINTKFKHTLKFWNKTSLYQAWQSTLISTMYEEQIPYHLFMRDGKIQLVELPQTDEFENIWIFEHRGVFGSLIEAHRTISLKDRKFANKVVPYLQEKTHNLADLANVSEGIEYKPVINQESIDNYGLFTTFLDVTNAADYDAVIRRMELIAARAVPSDHIDFRTYAINSIKPSDPIMVVSKNLYAAGIYFVEDIDTDVSDNNAWHNISATKYRNIPDDLLIDLEGNVQFSGLADLALAEDPE